MAASGITIDIIENARWVEEQGKVLEISRVAILHGLTIPPGFPGTQPRDAILRAALDESELPQPNDRHPIETALILRHRRVNALGPTMVHVELIYKLPGGLEQPQPFQNMHISGSASIEQITASFDRDGTQITVEHNGDVQGGQVDITEARQEENFTGIIASANPGALLRVYANKVNSATFLGISPGFWFCPGVSWESEDLSLDIPTWRVGFQFRLRDGDILPWDPRVVYIDAETGQPPSDLQDGIGFKIIPWYFSINFNNIFDL